MKLVRTSVLLSLSALALPALGQEDVTETDATPPGSAQAVPVADDDDIVILDGTSGDTDASEGDAEDAAAPARPVPAPDAATATQAPPEAGDVVGPASPQGREEELLAQFRRFRELMDNNSIDEADIVAKRIVELAIRINGPRSIDTAKALTNLAIVQQRTEQYDAAIQNFEGAIEIIEDKTDRLDGMLVNPLKGLGAAQVANGRPDQAAQTFGRAIHITHVNEGPHNVDQIEILESLAETNLILGELDQARSVHELIYNLNERHYRSNMLDLVPSLVRRARWQHRTGYYNDERATYRRVIRILEERNGKNDLSLIEPLIELGRSYYFVDTNEGESFVQSNPYHAEVYFKKAVRIAEESNDATWMHEADTKLALADYYMQQQSVPTARKVYRDVWDLLSADEERLVHRKRTLEELNPLILGFVPEFAGDANRNDLIASDIDVREGSVAVTFDVSSRGRVANLQVVEFSPADFPEMLRDVQRQMRGRLYRPRFRDGEAIETSDQLFTHEFYYRVSEMEERRAAQLAND